MSLVLDLLALVLLASLLAGLVRIWRGPGIADRMLAAQLTGTTGIGLLVILAERLAMPALRDVALVFALLGLLAVLAFVARLWDPEQQSPDRKADK